MARIAKLKEHQFHSDAFDMTPFRSIDIYGSKEELSGEPVLCVALDNNNIGYIPLTKNTTRGSYICVIGTDNTEYRLARQKKNIWEDITYCKLKVNLNNSKYNTMGNNYIQTAISSEATTAYIQAEPYFYNINNEPMNPVLAYAENNAETIFYINAYMTFSGNGNNYAFEYKLSEPLISGAVNGYLNRNLTATYILGKETAHENRNFQIGVRIPNSYNSGFVKMTFNNVTINGRQIPIILEQI